MIPSFSKARLLVVGDVMLDRYWSGAVTRISPEAPVPVVQVGNVEDRPGGAANVAMNAAMLGADVSLLGVTGDDEESHDLARTLNGRVQYVFERIQGARTTTKLRVLNHRQQMMRLDFEAGLTGGSDSIDRCFTGLLDDAEVVVLSDYGKGALNNIGSLIDAARLRCKEVLVDPKGRDFDKYAGATVLTPNLQEFEAIVGKCRNDDDLVARAESLLYELSINALLITRGEHGMTLVRVHDDGVVHVHIPSDAKEVFDVTGAGDTVIAVLGAALAAGMTIEQAARLSNRAAGIVVGKVGTSYVTMEELTGEKSKIMDAKRLMQSLDSVRGSRLVMTNGCFDLLHAGHIEYLEKAKKLGDCLIVAINDDASVRRLKGERRPLNCLADRMRVLAALECVDYVVPFSEDTPERLIQMVSPDVLVKGGDYKNKAIVGREFIERIGGKVVVLPHTGQSTTDIVNRVAH